MKRQVKDYISVSKILYVIDFNQHNITDKFIRTFRRVAEHTDFLNISEISIINKIKKMEPGSEILYIGTTDRMEKDIVVKIVETVFVLA